MVDLHSVSSLVPSSVLWPTPDSSHVIIARQALCLRREPCYTVHANFAKAMPNCTTFSPCLLCPLSVFANEVTPETARVSSSI